MPAPLWKVECGRILTDLGAPLNITYTRTVTDPASFDALFTEMLAARIAADVAVSLTESTGKAQALWQVYQSKLIEAGRRDAQDNSGKTSTDGYWAEGR